MKKVMKVYMETGLNGVVLSALNFLYSVVFVLLDWNLGRFHKIEKIFLNDSEDVF